MTTNSQTGPAPQTPGKTISIKVFGVGNAGVNLIEPLARTGLAGVSFVAVNTDAESLAASSAAEKVLLETNPLRGLGTGADPERGRALAEEHLSKLKPLCEGAEAVFVVTGLGGGAGTGVSPVLARVAKETGALVLGFVLMPFECEGARRQRLAEHGLEELKETADGVVCLPNQKVFKLIDENTSVIEAFKLGNDLLADGLRAVWRLLTHAGLIEIHFADVCALIRDRHAESAFAVAEAMGPTRSREVMDKLLAHPMLDGGQVLDEADTVLVSLAGGPDLTMAEVNRVMEQINHQCGHAQVIMGAAIDQALTDRLAVTIIAARKDSEAAERAVRLAAGDQLGSQLLDRVPTPHPGSRFVPPPPTLNPEQMEQLAARQARFRGRKNASKMRQTQLPLEIISKGRFDKSEPTIHKGEDLDVPTYIRRGVALN
jgi:cell division protein FtsZ